MPARKKVKVKRRVTQLDVRAIREARELLERAAEVYADEVAVIDSEGGMLTQNHLAIAREFDALGRPAEAVGKVFSEIAIALRPRVVYRAKALTEDPLGDYADLPVESGPLTVAYKTVAGRASISWKDKAMELRITVAQKVEKDKGFGVPQAEAWAKAETAKAPKGPETYKPVIEIRT